MEHDEEDDHLSTSELTSSIRGKFHNLDPRRVQQIARRQERLQQKSVNKGYCTQCLLLPRFCICDRFVHLPYHHPLSIHRRVSSSVSTDSSSASPSSTLSSSVTVPSNVPAPLPPPPPPTNLLPPHHRRYPPDPFSRPSSFYDIQISILLHSREENRSTSTHKVIVESFPFTRIYIPDSGDDGTMITIWQNLQERSRKIYRYRHIPSNTYYEDEYYQTIIVLWPVENKSITVSSILNDIYTKNQPYRNQFTVSSSVPTNDIELLEPSSPEREQKDNSMPHFIHRKFYRGLHIVGIDGTWKNALHISRALPISAHLVTIENPYIITLFQPLRRQPSPGRVSTAEAIACVFDDWERYYSTAFSSSSSSLSLSSLSTSLSSVSVSSSFSNVDTNNNVFKNPHIYNELLPRCPSYISRLIRYNLCILVDGITRQTGHIGTYYGVGYRTWTLGKKNNEKFGLFHKLPTWILEQITNYAYGPKSVNPSGYDILRHGSSSDWLTLVHNYQQEQHSKSTSVSSSDNVLSPTTEITASSAMSLSPSSEATVSIPVVLPTSSPISSSFSSSLSTSTVTITKRFIHQGGTTTHRALSLKNGCLPPASEYTRIPLAHVNHYFYCWAAGAYKLEPQTLPSKNAGEERE